MVYNDPTPQQVDALKALHTDRTLHVVEATDGEDVYVFIMTSALEVEHQKMVDELTAADLKTKSKERNEALRDAVKKAALAQIRHPARDEVQRIFSLKPLLVDKFAGPLQEHAGGEMEVRTKKL